MHRNAIAMPPVVDEKMSLAEERGLTAVLVAINGMLSLSFMLTSDL